MSLNGKKLRSLFAAAFLPLGGCATMAATDTNTCMSRQGVNFMGLISSRSDSYDTDCATAQAAKTISAMRKPDGSPNIHAHALALKIYENSNPDVKKYMEQVLKDQEGKSIDDLKFTVKQSEAAHAPLVCERATVNGAVTYKCKTAATAAP